MFGLLTRSRGSGDVKARAPNLTLCGRPPASNSIHLVTGWHAPAGPFAGADLAL
jgi:hypothetical protein